MLTREEVEVIISSKNGGIEAYMEVARLSWNDGYACGKSDGLDHIEDYLKFDYGTHGE